MQDRTCGKVRRRKWLWWSLFLFVALAYVGYEASLFIGREFMVAEELPIYAIGSRPADDTLRVAVIGDSWAMYHAQLGCDTLFEQYAGRLTAQPVRCMSRGTGGAKSTEVEYAMFRNQVQGDSQMACTQPLLEAQPEYGVVMAGINDTWKKRPVSYYTGNYRLILRLLLANHIRPVVMEIPDFEMGEWLDEHRRRQRCLYRFYSYFTGVVADDIAPFRNGLRQMLKDTGLADSVLFIATDQWLPQGHRYSEEIYQADHVHLNRSGYHLLDSCIVAEIVNDYQTRKTK